jgi:AIPR protein
LGTDVQVSAEGDRLTVKGLQVINGAQTVKALFRATQPKDVWKDDEPLVVVRVTEVSRGYGAEGRFANEVIRFNNTQNVIKASDFKSNDPVQNDLVAKFKRLMRFGRSVEYIPKRIEPSRRNAWLIRMEEFAKVVYSFVKNPIDFSGSTSFLFDESEKGGYAYAFGDGRFPYSPTMPEDAFRLRAAIWWMSEAFSEARKADREKSTDVAERGGLERKWMLIYAARLVLERSFGEAESQQRLAKFWKGEWELGTGEDGKWFSQLYENSKAALILVYEQSMKQSTFVHRNWMRSEETLSDLRSFIKRAPGMALK